MGHVWGWYRWQQVIGGLYLVSTATIVLAQTPTPTPSPSTLAAEPEVYYLYEPGRLQLRPLPYRPGVKPLQLPLQPRSRFSPVPVESAPPGGGNSFAVSELLDGRRTVRYSRPLTNMQLPQLKSHSPWDLGEVYLGQKVSLSVVMTGAEAADVKWVRDGMVVCSGTECVLNTKGWSPGVHFLRLAVYNRVGLRLGEFRLRVLATEKANAELLKPELVEASSDAEYIDFKTDPYVRARRSGMSYSHKGRYTDPIEGLPQLLRWDEILTADADGLVSFGIGYHEQHFLLPASSIRLHLLPKQKRLLDLRAGGIRSRVFAGSTAPAPRITMGEWIEIIPEANADVVVQEVATKGRKGARVTVLRGSVVVSYTLQPAPAATAFGSSSQRQTLGTAEYSIQEPKGLAVQTRLGQGMSLNIAKSQMQPAVPEVPVASNLEQIMRLTTPEYLPDQGEKAFVANNPEQRSLPGGFNSVTTSAKNPISAEAAKAAAINSIDSQDALGALEYLLAGNREAAADSSYQEILAKAYRHLGLYTAALALKIRPSTESSLSALVSNDLPTAMSGFAGVLAANPEPAPKLLQSTHYYLGIAAAKSGNTVESRRSMQKSLWFADDPILATAAREHLDVDTALHPHSFDLFLGGFYDSNIWGANPSATLPEPLTQRAGLGVEGRMQWLWRAVALQTAQAEMGLTGNFRAFKDYALGSASFSDTTLFALFSLPLLQDDANRAQTVVSLRPYLHEVRTNAGHWFGFGLGLGIGLPTMALAPRVILTLSQHRDALPASLSTFDPFHRQLEFIDDRTWQAQKWEVETTLQQSARTTLTAALSYEYEDQSAQAAQPLDRRIIQVQSRFTRLLQPWWRSYLEGSLGAIAFPEGTRSDSLIMMEAGQRYSFWPDLYAESSLNLNRQMSNESATDFMRIDIRAGMGYVF